MANRPAQGTKYRFIFAGDDLGDSWGTRIETVTFRGRDGDWWGDFRKGGLRTGVRAVVGGALSSRRGCADEDTALTIAILQRASTARLLNLLSISAVHSS
jgi:hypothetical protein